MHATPKRSDLISQPGHISPPFTKPFYVHALVNGHDGIMDANGKFFCSIYHHDTQQQGKASRLFERAVNTFDEAKAALKAMQAACDEWAAEFTQKKRAMNWGVVNDAYIKCGRVLARMSG